MTQSSTPDYARAKTVGFSEIPVIDLAETDTPAGRDAVAAALPPTWQACRPHSSMRIETLRWAFEKSRLSEK